MDALLGQARALRLAGKTAEGLTVLRAIVSGVPEETAGVAEAKVRLSEATAGAM